MICSNNKNTYTRKALVGISSNGAKLIFSEIYPCSVFDSNIEKSNEINWVKERIGNHVR